MADRLSGLKSVLTMVIELTDGLARCPVDKLDGLSVSIENLLIGYYEGNHILIISGPLCGYIRDHELIKSDRAEKALRAIEEGGRYDPIVLWHLRVVLDNANPKNHEVEFSFFMKSRTILPTAFLCENLEDIKFYLLLTKMYYPYTPLKASHYHGGGDTTSEVFDYLKGLKVPCLVILDSDIKYPGCETGNTARRCLTRYKKKMSHIEVKMLDVHEAENLLPIEFLREVASKRGFALLDLLGNKEMLDKLKYLDIKEGVKKEDVENNEGYMSFCEEIYNGLYKKKNNTFAKYMAQKRNASDYLFVQIGSGLLDKFNKNKNLAYHDDVMTPYRRQIAELVKTFICCRGYDPIN